jgi:hypothetical protein
MNIYDDNTCPSGWRRTEEKLGKGASGFVYRVCCLDNCNYAIKSPDSLLSPELFQKEADELLRRADLGLYPTIHYIDYATQDIIMDALDLTLEKLLQIYSDPVVQEEITHSLLDLLDRSRENNLIHGDISLRNIMAKVMNPNLVNEKRDHYQSEKEYYDSHNYRFYFIDIGALNDSVPTLKEMLDIDYGSLYMDYDSARITFDYQKTFRDKLNDLFNFEYTDPETGITNLMIYVANNPGIALTLMTRGMDPSLLNQQDHDGNTALIYSTQNDSPFAYEVLLLNGADPTIQNKAGHLAADYVRDPEDWERHKNWLREEIYYNPNL